MIVERFLEWVEQAPASQRAEATSALARAYLISPLEDEERESAEAAMTLLLDDASPEVRLSLAESLANSDRAPRHVVLALANDIPEIATTILSRSPMFLDAELVDLMATGTVEQQIAIACRCTLSPALIGAISEVGVQEACLGLLMNPSARCTARILHRIGERHGEDAEVRNIMLDRSDLPSETRMLLFEKLGSSLKSFVTGRGWISEKRAGETVRDACDKATITHAASAEDDDVERMVANLIADGKVTASFLLRSICMGNITFFSRAVAQLSGMPPSRVDAILVQDRQSAFKAVYAKAGLPERAFGVFQTAISTWRRLLSSGSAINQSRLPFLVTKEVLETYGAGSNPAVDDLLVLLRKLGAETARQSARARVSEMKEKTTSPPLVALPQPESDVFELDEERFLEEISCDVEEFVLEHTGQGINSSEIRAVEIPDPDLTDHNDLPMLRVTCPTVVDPMTKRELQVELAA